MELMKLMILYSFTSFIRNINKNIAVGKHIEDKKFVYGIFIMAKIKASPTKVCHLTIFVLISLLKSAISIPAQNAGHLS